MSLVISELLKTHFGSQGTSLLLDPAGSSKDQSRFTDTLCAGGVVPWVFSLEPTQKRTQH